MLCVCIHLQPGQPQARKNRQMPMPPTISNIHTEEDAGGVHIRIEGEEDFLPGHLTVMVRPAAEEETPGEITDSADSETSDWGRPAVMPIDMGFGHFMMNMQTGAICWRPSGTLQPDASLDWVVMNDPSISAGPAPDPAGVGHNHHSTDNDRLTAMEACPSSLAMQGSTNTTITDHAMATEGEMDVNETPSAEEPIIEIYMDQSAATDSARSQ